MRKINSVVEEPGFRRAKHSQSPATEPGGPGRIVSHAPVTSQSWGRSYTQQQVRQQKRWCSFQMMQSLSSKLIMSILQLLCSIGKGITTLFCLGKIHKHIPVDVE